MDDQSMMTEMRRILRNWTRYREHHYADGGFRSWWEPLAVDDMTDEQILEVVKQIASDRQGDDR